MHYIFINKCAQFEKFEAIFKSVFHNYTEQCLFFITYIAKWRIPAFQALLTQHGFGKQRKQK